MHRTAASLALAAVLVVLAGSPADAASDTSTVKKLVIVKSDLPSGWTATKGAAPDDTQLVALAQCVGRPLTDRSVTASKGGQDFTRGSDAELGSDAETLATKAAVDRDLRVLQDPKFSSCLEQQGRREQGVDTVNIETVKVPKYGDKSLAFAIDIVGKDQQGNPQRVDATKVFIRKGRAEITATFASAGHPPDPALVKSTLKKFNQRVKSVHA